MNYSTFLVALASLVPVAPVVAQSSTAGRELAIPRVTTKPVIDGVLDEPMWRTAAVLDHWFQTEPADNGTPHGPTVAYIAYDQTALYIAIRAKDEPGRIRARLHERDNVVMQGQDWIGISLDPTDSRRRAYSLAVNPLGIQGDGLTVEGTGFEEWDGIFDAAGKVTKDEYTIEVAIPFKSLRYPKGAGQRWGFSLQRNYGRDGATDSPWPRNRDLVCDLCQMITLTGIHDIGSASVIEVNPSVVGRTNRARPKLANPFDPARTSTEVGANLKYGITPNLTLDGTWNPDFSQIEADAGQLEINNRSALFFPERRPFFLEGTDIFLTRFPAPGQDPGFFPPPVNVFYSRRIVDPDAGVKVTGKIGQLSLGVLGGLDAARNYTPLVAVGGLSPSTLDPFPTGDARAGIARVKLDVLADGFVGAAITGRRFGDGYGLTGSIDSRLRFGSNTVFRFLAVRSRTEEPDLYDRVRRTLAAQIPDPGKLQAALDSLPSELTSQNHERRQGTAIQASLDYTTRHIGAGFGVVDITPGFETPLGFTPRTDYALASGYLSYRWQSTGFFRQIQPKIRFEEAYDHDRPDRIGALGHRTDRLVSGFLDFKLPAASTVSFGYTRSFLRFDGIDFPNLHRGFIFLSSDALRGFGWSMFARGGEEVIFSDLVEAGPSLPSFFVTGTVNLSIRPIAPLRIGFDMNTARVWRRSATKERESLYAESAIPRIKTQFQMSRRLGLRLIGEYRFERFYQRSGALDQKRDVFSTNILATYLSHPGQSVQIGWSTRADADLLLPLRTTAQGGVAKVTYLWRF